MKRTTTAAPKGRPWGFGKTLLLFAAVVCAFFFVVFLPGETLFSNDGPLSQLVAQCHKLPGRFLGCWNDMLGIGVRGGPAPPDITFTLQWLLGPVWFSKLYGPVSLLLLGVGAWFFLRKSGLGTTVCVLGGLAAILNSTFFSVACWGVSAHVLAAAMTFLALGLVADPNPRGRWIRVALAGFAVGMGVCEGADVGAILSVYLAAFIAYQALTTEGSRIKNLVIGLGRLMLVVACAGFLAAQAIYGFIGTSIKGIKGTEQNIQTKAERWNWATQWSLPKTEALGLVVPGLFGYRLDTQNGGAYWGEIGRDTAWDKYYQNGSQGTPPKGFVRYTGSGYYDGVLVALIALWAAIQCVRQRESAFNAVQRRLLWFWLAVCVGSLLLAFGRYAPLYRPFYELPYVSTIRNPVKFLYPFSFAVVVFFAFGVDALLRKYMPKTGPNPTMRWPGLWNWWTKADRFDKKWVYGCGLILVVSVIGAVVYASDTEKLKLYMQSRQVAGDLDAIMSFSIQHIIFFLVFFSFSAMFIALVFSGAFVGKRAQAGAVLLGALMLADLGLANLPWIKFWNYEEKYTSNPVIDMVREEPWQHRVAMTPVNLPNNEKVLNRLYQIEWLQQQFPYYNIQSFDVADLPRMPEDMSAFSKMFRRHDTNEPYQPLSRAWQLTNTRYIIAPGNFEIYWNKKYYLTQAQLNPVARFEIVPKEGVEKVTSVSQLTARIEPNGRFGLFELENALPRAKLYDQWQVNTNDSAALDEIFDPTLDIQRMVVVDNGLSAGSAAGTTNGAAGTVEYVSYAPKDIKLRAQATAPSVLLLNDHYDPNWKVFVDGQPATLLRCNYLMRGVRVEPGTHSVEFKFQPPFGFLYVSLTAIATALAAIGLLVVRVSKRPETPAPAPPSPMPMGRAAQPKPEPRKKAPANAATNGKK